MILFAYKLVIPNPHSPLPLPLNKKGNNFVNTIPKHLILLRKTDMCCMQQTF